MKDFRLKFLRTEKGLTQQKLAIDFNIEQSAISAYENKVRTPDIEIIEIICDYFDVSIDYLVGRSDIRNYPTKDFSNREINHISLYRKLDNYQKERLDGYLQGMVDLRH